jgi:lipoyl(octanoyl) transferase
LIGANPRKSAAKNLISVVQLGTVDYPLGLRLQQQLVALRKEEKIGDVLLLLEHKPVITLGRNAKAANVIASPQLLAQRGVELFECDRGGDVTFHGPGQLVGYPIFDLRGFARPASSQSLSSRAEASDSKNRSLESRDPGFSPRPQRKHLGAVDFVRCLEDALMRTCADFGIPTKRIAGLTGVWTDAGTGKSPVGTVAPGCPVEQSSTATEDRRSLDYKERFLTESFVSARDDSEEEHTSATAREAKLAAIGVHISRFVTSHGFALNVNADLSYFDLIIPCGITSKPVTSMERELGRALDLKAVAESVSRNFGVVFQNQMLWVDTIDALLGRTVGVPMQAPKELRHIRKEEDSAWA